MVLEALIARLLVLLTLVLAVGACGGDDEPATETQTAREDTGTAAEQGECEQVETPELEQNGGEEPPTDDLDEDTAYRLVVDTSCGSFTITLDQELAPKTAASLVSLAEAGYFDDTIFHRVVPGFVIQGGDPTGTGTGGPGYQTVDPPPADAEYTRGVVAMAKAGVEASGTAGSQFFVVTGPDVGLPPEYAVVGEVTAGMEAVDAIGSLGVGDGPPSMPVVIEQISVETG